MLVYGKGLNDVSYTVKIWQTIGQVNGKQKQKLIWICPYYGVWQGMLKRCYSKNYQQKQPTYEGCSVCEEWLKLSGFKAWMETQDWEGKQLDKDILFIGNKVYAPETCVFVSAKTNSFMSDAGSIRGQWPIGVCWSKRHGKFMAGCRNPFTGMRENLGYFRSPEDAHQAWLKCKLDFAKQLAELQNDARVAKALIDRYSGGVYNA
jgi:hypothetical protein